MICNALDKYYNSVKKSQRLKKCCNTAAKCIVSSDDRKEIKCEENKKKYVLNNPNKNMVTVYQVDGGVIVEDKSVPANTLKCDYMYCVENDSSPTAILIELKGTDVNKALDQVSATLDRYEKFFAKFSRVLCRIVVTNSTPKIRYTSKYICLSKRLKRRAGDIEIRERQLLETLN